MDVGNLLQGFGSDLANIEERWFEGLHLLLLQTPELVFPISVPIGDLLTLLRGLLRVGFGLQPSLALLVRLRRRSRQNFLLLLLRFV